MSVENNISVQISVTPKIFYKIIDRYAKLQGINMKHQEEKFIDVPPDYMLRIILEKYDELSNELCLLS